MFRISNFLTVLIKTKLELFRTVITTQPSLVNLYLQTVITPQITSITWENPKEIMLKRKTQERNVGVNTGANIYKNRTLFKIINQIKPVNKLLWGIVAEQYRVECDELKAGPETTIKKLVIQKM